MIPPPTATWPHCAGPHQFRARTRDRTRPAQEDRKRGEGHFQSPEALQHIGQRGGSGRGTKRHKQNGQRAISSTLQGFLHFEYACGPAFHVSRLRVIFVAICPNIPATQLFWYCTGNCTSRVSLLATHTMHSLFRICRHKLLLLGIPFSQSAGPKHCSRIHYLTKPFPCYSK